MTKLESLQAPQQAEPEFELGGPAYRLMQRLRIIKGAGPSIMRRTVVLIAVTWLPLLAFTTLEGTALGPTPRSSFLLDFATYARLFVALPLIFAAEIVAGPRLRGAGLRFVEGDIVHPDSRPGFAAAVARVRRRREAYLPELAFILVALIVGARFLTLEQVTGLGSTSWHTTWVDGELRLSASGLWYRFVVIPIMQFFVLRWVWRLVIWTLFLWEVSRLRLNLCATHTDMAAGLGFLGFSHVSLAIFPFAVGCVICAEIVFRARFEGLDLASLKTMTPLLIAYLVFVEVVTFGPLLVFLPLMVRTRREALRSYGILVQHHDQLFHDKWIGGHRPADEQPLGHPDMSSLVDLGSSYTVVGHMNIVPFTIKHLARVAVISLLPALPLVFLVLPFFDALKFLAAVVM